MSVDISVSSKNQKNCDDIILKLMRFNIDCRIIETRSVIDKKLEKGCLITLGHQYHDKQKLKQLWNFIKYDYSCCHLKIDGIFNGSINNYLYQDFCCDK
tara:strand:- start:176 stop:472 length:297 start_codon:yes stop_codon:yes gene_type:complete